LAAAREKELKKRGENKMNDLLKRAAALGSFAFEGGKDRVPYADKNLMALIPELEAAGCTVEAVGAWQKGFDESKETAKVKAGLKPKTPHTRAIDGIVTRDEFTAMLKVAKKPIDSVILALAIIGLRANEIAMIKDDWVDVSQGVIRIPASVAKKGHARTVPYNKVPMVSDIIRGFFVTHTMRAYDGVSLTRVAVWYRVKKLASLAGIKHPITVHSLRASGATWFAQAGFSLPGLQEHFGWKSIKTAQFYIQHSAANAIGDMNEKGAKIL
jgi:integrase/recombinase XerD